MVCGWGVVGRWSGAAGVRFVGVGNLSQRLVCKRCAIAVHLQTNPWAGRLPRTLPGYGGQM